MNVRRVRQGGKFEAFESSELVERAAQLSQLPMWIDDQGAVSVGHIASQAGEPADSAGEELLAG